MTDTTLPLDDGVHGARSVDVSPRRDEDERLPWLEPAVAADGDSVPAGKLAALVIAALVVLAVVVGGVFLLRQRTGPPAPDPSLITAPAGDYKVRPDAPGGMAVEGRGDSAFATSEGAEANGRVDLNALPESPVAGAKRPATASADQASKPATTATVGVPAAGAPLVARAPEAGPAVQLGSFPSEATANAAWATLSKRFAYLAPLAHNVQGAQVNGSTVYRLRAFAGSDPKGLCAKLTAAGSPCFVVS